ncbi:MAG: hypothetical protein ACOWWR_18520 [Eubacteriales bacterium]
MKYGGSFVSGLASGMQSGISNGLQIANFKWQKEQKAKEEELKNDYNTKYSEFINNPETQEYFAGLQDGSLDPYGKESAAMAKKAITFGQDVSDMFKEFREAWQSNNKTKADQIYEMLKLKIESVTDLNKVGIETNPKGIAGDVGNIADPNSMQLFNQKNVYANTPDENINKNMTQEIWNNAGGGDLKFEKDVKAENPNIPLDIAKAMNDAYKEGNAAVYNALGEPYGVTYKKTESPKTADKISILNQERVDKIFRNDDLDFVNATPEKYQAAVNKVKNSSESNATVPAEKDFVMERYNQAKSLYESTLGDNGKARAGKDEEGDSYEETAKACLELMKKYVEWYKKLTGEDLPLPELEGPTLWQKGLNIIGIN